MFEYRVLPKVKGFHVKVKIDESYADKTDEDIWEAAFAYDGNCNGISYNFRRNGEDSSVFYLVEEGDELTEFNEPYEIDFEEDNWREKLINAMIEAYYSLKRRKRGEMFWQEY